MIDIHGRNINYMRISLTDRCNLRCIYCMPENGIEKKSHDEIMRYEDVIKVVKVAASLGIKKIRYTGGEPLILSNIDKLIHETSEIKGIEDISLTTNGILLADAAEDLKKAGLKRVNISLDTLREDRFKSITRGGDLKKVLDAIYKCLEIGITPVKLNTVLMRGFNDDEIKDLVDLTRNLPVHVRFIELMPIGEASNINKNCVINSDQILKGIDDLIPVQSDRSSTASMYRLKNSKGYVGLISPLSCKFCQSCNRIRLTASGTLKPCLHSENEINIKDYLSNEVLLASVIKDAIYNKPSEHHLIEDEKSMSKKMMYQIGG